MKDEGRSPDVVVRLGTGRHVETADSFQEVLRIERRVTQEDLMTVMCAPEVQSAQLGAFLRIAVDVGYRSFSFVCAHNEETFRPIMGALTRVRLSAVKASAASVPGRRLDIDGESVAKVSLRDYGTFGDLARRMAELRRADQQVVLDLSP